MGDYDGLLHLMGLSMAICGIGWILVNVYEKCVTSVEGALVLDEDTTKVTSENHTIHETEVSDKEQHITKL